MGWALRGSVPSEVQTPRRSASSGAAENGLAGARHLAEQGEVGSLLVAVVLDELFQGVAVDEYSRDLFVQLADLGLTGDDFSQAGTAFDFGHGWHLRR